MEETYRKVVISSKGDLPRNEGIYYVHVRSIDQLKEWVFDPFGEDHKQWLSSIDWYLQRVTDKEATTEKPVMRKPDHIQDDVTQAKYDIKAETMEAIIAKQQEILQYYADLERQIKTGMHVRKLERLESELRELNKL